MNSQTETYANVVNFSNYQVSNFGNVKNVITGRILKQNLRGGYLSVGMTCDGDRSMKTIHRLVAIAFLPNPENKICVDHISRDKTNNHISNLRWATSTENQQNVSIRLDNSSGITGVNFDKLTQKWRARITADGGRINLGLFQRIEDANVARENAEILYFGEFRATA